MCVRNRKQSIHNYAIVTVNEMIMKLTYFQQSFNQVMNMEERRHYCAIIEWQYLQHKCLHELRQNSVIHEDKL